MVISTDNLRISSEQESVPSQRTVYWTERHEQAMQKVYEIMKRKGIPCEYKGKPNVGAILEYAMNQTIIHDTPATTDTAERE